MIGSTRYDPSKRVKVKGVEDSEIETFGTVKAKVQVGNNSVPYEFQLVNKQVDIPCDGIKGRDFLCTKARMCYGTQRVTVGKEVAEDGRCSNPKSNIRPANIRKSEVKEEDETECVVKIPTRQNVSMIGIVRKQEILAEALTKVVDGCVTTGVINTHENEVEIEEPIIELEEMDPNQGVVQHNVSS